MRKELSRSDCLLLLEAYLSYNFSKSSFERENNLSKGWVNFHLAIFGIEDKPHSVCIMSDRLSKLESLPGPLLGDDELRKTISEPQSEVRELKHSLKLSNLARDAYDCMITEAEKKYVIPIRKKLRCQVVSILTQSSSFYKVSPLCGLLGISTQGYYKHKEKRYKNEILISSIVLYCNYIRSPDILPRVGCRELLQLCRMYFAENFTLGRDCFYDVLRANGLMLKRKRYRPIQQIHATALKSMRIY